MRCLTLSVGLSLLCFGPIQACGEAPVEPEQAAAPSPSGEPAPAGVDGALATVNGVSITPDELEARVGKQIPLTALTQPRIEGVLETMIHEELLYQEALRLKLDQSPRVRRVMTSLLRQEVLEAQLKEVSFPEEELLAWYREHQDDYILPEQVRLRRILIKGLPDETPDQTQARAEALHVRLQTHPERFPRIARQNSSDPYAQRGGEIGMVTRGGKPGVSEALVDAAFELPEGSLSDIIMNEEGHNILFVESKHPARQQTFTQVKSQVLKRFQQEALREITEAYLAEIQAEAELLRDPELLAAWLSEHRSKREAASQAALKQPPASQDPEQGSGDSGEPPG